MFRGWTPSGGGGGSGNDDDARTYSEETTSPALRRMYHENLYFKYRAARMGLQHHRTAI
jgi:hypothetical protein